MPSFDHYQERCAKAHGYSVQSATQYHLSVSASRLPLSLLEGPTARSRRAVLAAETVGADDRRNRGTAQDVPKLPSCWTRLILLIVDVNATQYRKATPAWSSWRNLDTSRHPGTESLTIRKRSHGDYHCLRGGELRTSFRAFEEFRPWP